MLAVLLVGTVADDLVRRAGLQVDSEGAESAQISCGKSLKPFKRHFDSLRASMGIDECSKQDVCLLMRELDMDFYNRAVAGELDGAGEAERRYLEDGTCKHSSRGVRMQDLTAEDCEEEAQAKGVEFERVRDADVPSGCFQEEWANTERFAFNTMRSYQEAGVQYMSTSRSTYATSTKHTYKVVCDEVKNLDDAEATFFSPYKLKEEMKGRPQASTACSPGKMAQMFRDGLTSSPCGEVLSFQTQAKYRQAEDAIAAGDFNYAKRLMEDNVLFDVITNHWCPEIWNEVATCKVSRRGFSPKDAMVESECDHISDELLSDLTDGLDPNAPPDFYRDAQVGGGGGTAYTGAKGMRRGGHAAPHKMANAQVPWAADVGPSDSQRLNALERRVDALEEHHH